MIRYEMPIGIMKNEISLIRLWTKKLTYRFLQPGHCTSTIPFSYACFENSCDDLLPHPSTVQVNVIESLGSILPTACLPTTGVSSVSCVGVFSSLPRFSVLLDDDEGGDDDDEEAVE